MGKSKEKNFLMKKSLIYAEVKLFLKECVHIFSFEPAHIQEGQICAIAQLDLIEVDAYIDTLIQK